MFNGKSRVVMMLGAIAFAVLPLARAQEKEVPRADIVQGVEHAVSPAMRHVTPTPPSPAAGLIPVRHPMPRLSRGFQPDPALQTQTTTSSTVTHTSPGPYIGGIGSDGYIPPDTNIAVGNNQVVETVNVEYAVYNKSTGQQMQAPMAVHNIFAALGSPCGTSDGGDPVVLYDHLAGRWLISQLEYNRSMSANYECVAISQTSDATGGYNLYALSFGSTLPDYPKWGIWADGYYLSANLFRRGSTFQGAAACALPRDAMLAGDPITSSQVICFQDPAEASFLPADLDGVTPPATGETEYFANYDSTLELYRFHVDFTTPSNSTFTGPIPVSGAASFTQACGGGTCVPQPGTNEQLDSLGDRLMYRLSYRNFGTRESLLVTHSVQVSSGGQTGIRWYEVENPAATPDIRQQGTYSPDSSTYRWMGSIAQDHNGDIAVGYSVSDGSSTYPGIRYAGHVPGTDPLGSLEAETTIVDGSGYQTTYSRWGDYSSMSIDPSDDCTFWYATEYKASSGSFNWSTMIHSFEFSGCGATTAPAAPSGLKATPGDSQVSLSWNTSTGATSYDVWRSDTGSAGTYSQIASGLSSTSYTDSGLADGTSYCYEVKAANSAGTSSPSGPQCAMPTLQTPTAPTSLNATAGDNQVSLAWNGSTGATSYNVYRSQASGAYGTTPLTTVTSASYTYTDSSAANGTTYYYVVTAVNSAGESGPSNEVTATPQSAATLNPPTNLSAKANGKSGKIGVSWTQSTSANIVENKVYRNDGQITTLSATTTFTDANTSRGSTYCYQVTAVNASGSESAPSNSSCATAGATAK